MAADANFDLDEALSFAQNLSLDMHDAVMSPEKRRQKGGESVLQEIAKMPMVVGIERDEVCVVCMENLESSVGGKQVPCGHVYHAACISAWLFHTNCCPLCRSTISGAEK